VSEISSEAPAQAPAIKQPLPLAGLLALASAGFITILTEALPAGLLPEMGRDLAVSEGLVGQLITVYALGSLLAAIPVVAMTRHWPRRPLLMLAIAGFAIANTVTTLSPFYALTLVARLLAGVSAGVLWALLAGYASGMVAPAQQGRAIAVAMVGTPLALSLGIPFGTLLGHAIGWQWTFAVMSGLSLVILVWARRSLPDLPGQATRLPLDLRGVLALPGVGPVLTVMLLFVLAHNVLYTYVAPLVAYAGALRWLGVFLLLFGGAAILGIWVVGALIDRWMRPLTLTSVSLFGVATLLLVVWPQSTVAMAIAFIAWGLAFGGAATLFQTAIARHAGQASDVAQSMVVTGWNLAIAAGGLFGGLLLQQLGSRSLAWSALPVLVAALLLARFTRGFPRH
jgi:predicted MFS family arabinose efflux permease